MPFLLSTKGDHHEQAPNRPRREAEAAGPGAPGSLDGSVFSGSGAQVRSTILAAQNFTGGLELAPDDSKNHADDVAVVINALAGGIGAVASGDGSATIGGVVGPVSFAGGSSGIDAPAVPELE